MTHLTYLELLQAMAELEMAAAQQHPEWKVFSLTYIEYPEGDPLGKLLSVLSLTPLVIVIASLSVFAVKRDLHTMTYGAGMIANGLVRVLPV